MTGGIILSALFFFSYFLKIFFQKHHKITGNFRRVSYSTKGKNGECAVMDMSGGKTGCISIQGDVPVLTDTVMKEGTSVKWYVLCTDSGREQEAVELMEKKISRELWGKCRILKKQQLFRTQGRYLLSRKDMFPGYIFVSTESPEELARELERAKRFPQLAGSYRADIVPVEQKDLHFLENVCGKGLEHDMRLSTVRVDEDGQVRSAVGALEPYVGRITRQRLRHRYVTAEIPLFCRRAEVLFGIRMDGDPA